MSNTTSNVTTSVQVHKNYVLFMCSTNQFLCVLYHYFASLFGIWIFSSAFPEGVLDFSFYHFLLCHFKYKKRLCCALKNCVFNIISFKFVFFLRKKSVFLGRIYFFTFIWVYLSHPKLWYLKMQKKITKMNYN